MHRICRRYLEAMGPVPCRAAMGPTTCRTAGRSAMAPWRGMAERQPRRTLRCGPVPGPAWPRPTAALARRKRARGGWLGRRRCGVRRARCGRWCGCAALWRSGGAATLRRRRRRCGGSRGGSGSGEPEPRALERGPVRRRLRGLSWRTAPGRPGRRACSACSSSRYPLPRSPARARRTRRYAHALLPRKVERSAWLLPLCRPVSNSESNGDAIKLAMQARVRPHPATP